MIGLAAVAAVFAVALIGRPGPTSQVRLARAFPPTSALAPPPEEARSPLRLVMAAIALVAIIAVVGGSFGAVAGVVVAAVIASVRPRARVELSQPDDVAVVVDLVAGCLDAGASLPRALLAASVASEGVLAQRCRAAAAALQAGAPADEAWRPWLGDPWLAPVARTAMRTAQSGAAAAEDLRRTSSRLRARRRAAAQHRVRQASVWLVVPLGLCFLPAFVLLAVVPIVLGLLPSLH